MRVAPPFIGVRDEGRVDGRDRGLSAVQCAFTRQTERPARERG